MTIFLLFSFVSFLRLMPPSTLSLRELMGTSGEPDARFAPFQGFRPSPGYVRRLCPKLRNIDGLGRVAHWLIRFFCSSFVLDGRREWLRGDCRPRRGFAPLDFHHSFLRAISSAHRALQRPGHVAIRSPSRGCAARRRHSSEKASFDSSVKEGTTFLFYPFALPSCERNDGESLPISHGCTVV